MTKKITLALIVALPLAACSDKLGAPPAQPAMTVEYSNSVGFTGVNGEPHPLLD